MSGKVTVVSGRRETALDPTQGGEKVFRTVSLVLEIFPLSLSLSLGGLRGLGEG